MLEGIKAGREDFVPDLIMIDGGKGHLNAAAKVLVRERAEGELISIAKQFEWIHSPKFSAPIVMASDSPALYLLKKVRDEAHRFAITYHRSLKSKGLEASVLDGIDGVGPKRKRLLLKYFEDVASIRNASLEALCDVPGIDRDSAAKVFSFFHPA